MADLESNFRPVTDEIDAAALPVTGAIPPELDGVFMRNGMNAVGPASHSDWLLGDGMIHAVSLRNGQASGYRNRWVRTDRLCDLLGEKRLEGQPRRRAPKHLSVANTHIIMHGPYLLALFEACLPAQMAPDLRTIGRFDFGGRLTSPMTSHPKADPDTGDLYFFGYHAGQRPWLRAHRVTPDGALAHTQDVELPEPVMMHDFAVTAHHLVFLDLPLVFDAASAGLRRVPLRWNPEHQARIGVSDKNGRGARWFDIPPCWVFHIVNAFEAGTGVTVDVLRYRSALNREAALPQLYRWHVDLATGAVRETQLNDIVQEFPRIDDRATGRPYRYSYTAQAPVRPVQRGPGRRGPAAPPRPLRRSRQLDRPRPPGAGRGAWRLTRRRCVPCAAACGGGRAADGRCRAAAPWPGQEIGISRILTASAGSRSW